MSVSPKKVTFTTNPQDTSLNPFNSLQTASIDLKKRASQLNKNILKLDLNPDKLEKLKRETLRGECRAPPEARLAAKPQKKTDLLTQILKSEHKNSKYGTQIIKLPKLPFGKHQSYNEEPAFRDRHFCEKTPEMASEKIKELEEITQKFRLHLKKFKAGKKSRLQGVKPLLRDFAFHTVYDMGAGNLVCESQDEIVKLYEKEKKKFVEMGKTGLGKSFEQIDVKAPESKYLMRRTINTEDEGKLVKRLMPKQGLKDTNLSVFYSSKYSSLFEGEEKNKEKLKMRRSSMQ